MLKIIVLVDFFVNGLRYSLKYKKRPFRTNKNQYLCQNFYRFVLKKKRLVLHILHAIAYFIINLLRAEFVTATLNKTSLTHS